jgi:iron complex outermembrane receptor protein
VNTGELGVRGTFKTGSVQHRWVASLSTFTRERKNAFAWDFFNTQATNLYNPVFSPQLPFTANAFTGNALDAPGLTNRTRLTSFAVGDTMGLMGNQVLLTLGLRHQRFDITNFAYGTGAQSDRYQESHTSPLVAAVVKLSPQWSVYANRIESLAQGETAPGFGSPLPTNAGQSLAPYVSKQTELGAKWQGARLGANMAVFSTSKPRGFINAANTFVAEGKDQHQGIEFNGFGQVARGWRVLGGFTFLDATQDSTGSSTTDGKRVIGVPRFQANLGTQWVVPQLPALPFDARLVHVGDRFANSTNTLKVDGFNRIDLGARYIMDVGGKPVTLRARLDNVTNRGYWASVGGFPGQGYLVVGAPRSFMLSASIDL